MDTVLVVGAGQLGSRHIQALKAVKTPLHIVVIDPSHASREQARQRYEDVPSGADHIFTLCSEVPAGLESATLLIVATNANCRFEVFRAVVEQMPVRAAVLEKILFSDPRDYDQADSFAKKQGVKVWVNCSMRQTQIYRRVADVCRGHGPVSYQISGSRFGLMTNAIHYVDHMCHVLRSADFSVDPIGLKRELVPSKRHGFLECIGTLQVHFSEGSIGSFTSFENGSAPLVVDIASSNGRFIVGETEGKAMYSGSDTDWQWETIEGTFEPQSRLTTALTESILEKGSCLLTPLSESIAIHRKLFEPVRKYLGQDILPFT